MDDEDTAFRLNRVNAASRPHKCVMARIFAVQREKNHAIHAPQVPPSSFPVTTGAETNELPYAWPAAGITTCGRTASGRNRPPQSQSPGTHVPGLLSGETIVSGAPAIVAFDPVRIAPSRGATNHLSGSISGADCTSLGCSGVAKGRWLQAPGSVMGKRNNSTRRFSAAPLAPLVVMGRNSPYPAT